jgi:L-aminopeptidase/D-esterase-like protein
MSRTPSLTDIKPLLTGHYTLQERPTGCTVVTAARPFVAGIDVRGGAPGTRETELLKPENSIDQVDAIFLSGGSAFGLDAGAGISRFLEEQGRGFDTGAAKVPIVCGAILFDLILGDPRIRPDATAGYEAIRAASNGQVPEGNVGAGAGATVGKALGLERAMKGGLGSWAISCPDGLKVGALAAVNSLGDVVDPATGRIIAGARNTSGQGFADSMEALRKGYRPAFAFHGNTVLGIVATNAALSKTQCARIAAMAHDGLARCISPSHLPWDGDAVFAISTGTWSGEKEPDAGLIGALAADALATAILRGVRMAESWGPYPAAGDYSGARHDEAAARENL